MTNLPMFPESASNDDTPLPLLVAKRWNFPLAHVETEKGMFYAVQDWMRGLSGEENTSNLWSMFKKTDAGKQSVNSIVRLPYKANDRKTYKRNYTTDKGLYIIAQYMRVKHDRPMLDEIRRFLAAAGAFVDEVRRDRDVLAVAVNVNNPDKLLDAFIEYYRKRGKDDRWIQARMESKIKRNLFTTALASLYSTL
jgi:hypothetical protein